MSFIVEKEFEHAGLKCVVTFGDMGHRCGYVGVDKTHPLYGKDYTKYLDIKKEDISDREISGIFQAFLSALDDDERVRIDTFFNCHGGITFSDGGKDSKYPIESDLWWFGFDCAHWGDGRDLGLAYKVFPEKRKSISYSIAFDEQFGILNHHEVRSAEYVEEECKRLAEQLDDYKKIIEREEKV